jgi:hypothetical protein
MKYVNSGRLGLFETINKSGSQTIGNTSINPLCGVAFTQTNVNFKIPITVSNKECWLKAKMYIQSRGDYTSNSFLRFFSSNHWAAFMVTGLTGTHGDCYLSSDTNNKLTGTPIALLKVTPYDVELHVKSDATAGLIEVFVNGVKQDTYTGNILNGEDITSFQLFTYDTDRIQFSDIICQDTGRIGLEHVTELVIKSTVSEWTANGNGSYYVTAEAKKLIKQLDVDAFKTALGTYDSLQIKGVKVCGFPAYYSADGLMNMLDIIVNDGTTDTVVQEKTLGSTTSDCVNSDIMANNPLTSASWDLTSLAALYFGVKSKIGS